MTLQKALQVTGFMEDDLVRVDIQALQTVISGVKAESDRFPYDNKLKEQLEAYKTILAQVQR